MMLDDVIREIVDVLQTVGFKQITINPRDQGVDVCVKYPTGGSADRWYVQTIGQIVDDVVRRCDGKIVHLPKVERGGMFVAQLREVY